MEDDYKNYIRLKRDNKKLVIQVCEIEWNGPSLPISKWKTVKTLDSSIELVELDKAVLVLLNDGQYFKKCCKCKEYNVKGHIHSDGYCQGCASSYLGVVY
jgi:hypothetical protein